MPSAESASETTGQSPLVSWTRQLPRSLRDFLSTESGSASVLLAATVLALVWANSPLSDQYVSLWETELELRLGSWVIAEDLQHWVNDGLMVAFFFVIGLEVRRELSMGELSDARRISASLLAALGGLLLPAAIYLALNPSGPEADGFGIALATDTAFMLGALALIGPGLSNRLRVFLLTVTVFDDMGAIAVVAIAYTDDLNLAALGVAAVLLLAILVLKRLRVWRAPAYVVVGIGLWLATFESGIHPTVLGIVLGLMTTVHPPPRPAVERAARTARSFGQAPTAALAREAKLSVEAAVSPNERLQELLHPWTSYVVVPIFALANAGIILDSETIERSLSSTITIGIICGLVLGKLAGVSGGVLAATRSKLGAMPAGVGPIQTLGGAALAGIGFTVSLFIVELAFADQPELAEEAKVGILVAGLISVMFGWLLFKLANRRGEIVQRPRKLARPVEPERDHIRGPADAPLTLVEYSDFECPFCGQATGVVDDLREQFGDQLRYVFRHLPLTDLHPRAELAAEAAEAAAEQDRFWEMHDRLFTHHEQLGAEDLLEHAAAIGLDVQRFARELGEGAHAARIDEDVESAEAGGVSGTPTFFVNGLRHSGPWDAVSIASSLRAAETGEVAPEAGSGAGPKPAPTPSAAQPSLAPGPGSERDGERGPELPPDLIDLQESPDPEGASPALSDGQIASLDRRGSRRPIGPGETLFEAGDPGYDFFVVIEGKVAIVEGYGDENRVLIVHGRHRFLGELSILSSRPALVTAVCLTAGEVLVLSRRALRAALAADQELKRLVMRSYLLRRALLLGASNRLTIVGNGSSADSKRLRDVAGSHGLRFTWIDLETDEHAHQLLDGLGVEPAELPVVIAADEGVHLNPSDAELLEAARARR